MQKTSTKRANRLAESMAATEVVPDTQVALAAAVTATPDDDLPRLVMADWLDESGGEAARGRAEFIRLQVATGGRPTTGDLARAEELLARYGQRWAAELGVRGHNWGPGQANRQGEGGGEWVQGRARFYYHRGFVDRVTCSPDRFAEAAGTLFRWHPVQDVSFHDGRHARTPAEPGWLRPALARPEMRRVAAVSFCDSAAADRHLKELSEADTLADRIDLDMSAAPHLSPLAVSHIGGMGSGRLRAYRAGRFGCGDVDSRGEFGPSLVEILAGSAAAGAVEVLNLHSNRLGDVGLAIIASGRWRPARLLVCDCLVSWLGVGRLVGSQVYAALRCLSLTFNLIGDVGAEIIADSPASAGLRELFLTATGIGDHGAFSLAGSPHLGGLENLSLWGNPRIGEAAHRALKERFGSRVEFR